jgi:hypothetical protein
MDNAEREYQEALARMQAGDLKGAIESIKAAGRVALRLQFLYDDMMRASPRAPAVAAPALPEPGKVKKEAQAAGPAAQPPAVESSLPGQLARIANMSMSALGAPQKLYFSTAVARFDLVAAEGFRDPGIMEKVLSGMDENWEAARSIRPNIGTSDLSSIPSPWLPNQVISTS